jgi:hypothetical protein
MTKLSKSEQVVKWIPVKNICVVWAHAQRGFDERAAARIAAEFDADAFGVIQVTLPNGEGFFHCVDGQTRVGAVRSMWGENEQVPCNVINAKDPARAADIFSKMNSVRTRPNVIERFNVAVTAGYEVEVGVNKLLHGLGYRVCKAEGIGVMRAVGTCVSLYKSMGPSILKDALLVIQGTWGKDQGATDASIIRGYAMFLAQHAHQIDKQRLVDTVKKEHTPGQLLTNARNIREVFRGSLAANILRSLVEIYNRGLRKGRIEETE